MATETKAEGNGTAAGNAALATLAQEAGIQEAELKRIADEERQRALAGIEYRPPRVGIEARTQQFAFAATGELIKELEVVVVFGHKARGLWEEGNKVPVCSSLDGKTGQGNPGRNCLACIFNKFGSDPKGSQGKACKEMRRLYAVRENDVLPVLLTLPPTSITAWDEYVSGVVGQKGTPSPLFLRTILTLEKQEDKTRGYTWSVLRPRQGLKLPITQALELRQLQAAIEVAATKVGIEAEDYYGAEEPVDVTPAATGAEAAKPF